MGKIRTKWCSEITTDPQEVNDSQPQVTYAYMYYVCICNHVLCIQRFSHQIKTNLKNGPGTLKKLEFQLKPEKSNL